MKRVENALLQAKRSGRSKDSGMCVYEVASYVYIRYAGGQGEKEGGCGDEYRLNPSHRRKCGSSIAQLGCRDPWMSGNSTSHARWRLAR